MNNLSFNETFRYRVKQMDEFMKRFNGIESIPLPLETVYEYAVPF